MDEWEPTADDTFEITSPYLDATNPQDVADVLLLAGDAADVTLNASVIKGRR